MGVTGALWLALAVGSAAALAWASSRWSHPDAGGAERCTAGVVWATAIVLSWSLLLGAAGAFSVVPVIGGLAVLAGVAVLWSRSRVEPAAMPAAPGGSNGGAWRVVTGGLVGLVAAQWGNSYAASLGRGMLDPDSQHYHLTAAARFVRTGEVFEVVRVSAGDLSAFHPLNDELLRAVGLLAAPSEATGIVWVVAVVVLALAAAAAAGRARGAATAMVAVTAAVMVLPGAGTTAAGSAANDWSSVALLLAALALWSRATSTRGLVVSGLAAGLAMGTKLSVLGGVGAFALASLLLPHPVPRGRRVAALAPAMALTGLPWFVRNLGVAGTPIPGLGLPGLTEPAAPLLEGRSFSVLHYATDVDVWRRAFLPGLEYSLGPLWPLVLVAVVLGVVVGLRGLPGGDVEVRSLSRMLGIVAGVSLVAYLLTPTGAAGPPGDPQLFAFNVRYMLAAIVAAGWVLALWLPTRVVVPASALVALVTLVPASSWDRRSVVWVVPTAVLVGLGAALARRSPRPAVVLAAALAAVALVGGPVAQVARDHRYSGGDDRSELLAVGAALGPADRAGVIGFPLLYGFTGDDLRTPVVYVGRERSDGAFVDLASCAALLDRVEQLHLTHVAVLDFAGQPSPPAAEWLRAVPGAQVVADNDDGVVVRVPRDLPTGSCPASGPDTDP